MKFHKKIERYNLWLNGYVFFERPHCLFMYDYMNVPRDFISHPLSYSGFSETRNAWVFGVSGDTFLNPPIESEEAMDAILDELIQKLTKVQEEYLKGDYVPPKPDGNTVRGLEYFKTKTKKLDDFSFSQTTEEE